MSQIASHEALRAVPPPVRVGVMSSSLALLALGHLTVDLYSSAVPTLQPILTEKFSLSLAQAGLLGGVFMFASSLLQLPIGVLSDRRPSRLYSALGPIAAAVFLSSLGLATGFGSLLALVFVGGLGVAMFHPQSTSQAGIISGARRGLGVGMFITAGMVGFSMGPPYFTELAVRLGFENLSVAMIPALIVTGVLLWFLPAPVDHDPLRSRKVDWAALAAHWKPLSLLYSLVVCRSVVQLGMGQFLTLYLYKERGFSLVEAGFALSLFFVAASLGSFLGGHLADRIGGAKVVTLSMAASAPFLALFLATTGWPSLLALFIGGVVLLQTTPVIVVMAQELVPSQANTVSALMMGFAWGLAGITVVPLIGWIADYKGLETVLWGVAATPLVGFLLARRYRPYAETAS